jgi:hypothetical protein
MSLVHLRCLDLIRFDGRVARAYGPGAADA